MQRVPCENRSGGSSESLPSQVSEPTAGHLPYICAIKSGSAVTVGKGSTDGAAPTLQLKPDPA